LGHYPSPCAFFVIKHNEDLLTSFTGLRLALSNGNLTVRSLTQGTSDDETEPLSETLCSFIKMVDNVKKFEACVI
jgi:hypothetical protein